MRLKHTLEEARDPLRQHTALFKYPKFQNPMLGYFLLSFIKNMLELSLWTLFLVTWHVSIEALDHCDTRPVALT